MDFISKRALEKFFGSSWGTLCPIFGKTWCLMWFENFCLILVIFDNPVTPSVSPSKVILSVEIIGCFDNNSDNAYIIEEGTRLLQICAPNLEPIQFELVEELSETSRGTGGYGSTGN